jgi:hypothetical protein
MSDRYIYLVYSKTGTWLSRAIGFFSDMKYVHASLSFDDSFTRMYSFGRTNPDNPFSGGFAEENLHGGVFKRFTDSRCLICRVAITNTQYESLKTEVGNFIRERYKYRYNFLGLIFAYFNIPFERSHHYFCSQFVSEVLIKSKIYESDISPVLIRPADLLSLSNAEIIFEGLISEFTSSFTFGEGLENLPSFNESKSILALIPMYSTISRKFTTLKNNFWDF